MGERQRRIERKGRIERENDQIQVTRGTILGIIPIGTARQVDPWPAVEPVLYLSAVSLKPGCEEFSEPKHVRKGPCTNTLQLESSGTFVHVNRFSILASDDDEKSLDGCDVAKQVTNIKSRTWDIGGEQDDGFSGRDERRRIGGERDDGFSCCDERVDECMGPDIKVNCRRDF